MHGPLRSRRGARVYLSATPSEAKRFESAESESSSVINSSTSRQSLIWSDGQGTDECEQYTQQSRDLGLRFAPQPLQV